MSEHREPAPGGPECWCLQCVFKRMDAKTAAARAAGLHYGRESALEPEDEAWLKGEAPDSR